MSNSRGEWGVGGRGGDGGGEGSNKMHQGENYQDFLKKRGGLFLGHCLIIIK